MMSLVRCAFCGRSQNDVARLVASNTSDAAICAPCVVRVVEVLITGADEPTEPAVSLTPEGQMLAARIAGRVS
ncbi:MAG TPA: ClpX C4-type zinc finger protein [Lichenihabitans sp.]|nr:ClpX C4-type zinc finger protein [Lichenihabitans sp.]